MSPFHWPLVCFVMGLTLLLFVHDFPWSESRLHLPTALCPLCLTLSSDARKGGHRDLPFPVPRQQEHLWCQQRHHAQRHRGGDPRHVRSSLAPQKHPPGAFLHTQWDSRTQKRAWSALLWLAPPRCWDTCCCRQSGRSDAHHGAAVLLRGRFASHAWGNPCDVPVPRFWQWGQQLGSTGRVDKEGSHQGQHPEEPSRGSRKTRLCCVWVSRGHWRTGARRGRGKAESIDRWKEKERNVPIKPNPKDPRALHKYQDCWWGSAKAQWRFSSSNVFEPCVQFLFTLDDECPFSHTMKQKLNRWFHPEIPPRTIRERPNKRRNWCWRS